MYQHPFANPEHLYGRASTLDYHMDRRSPPTPGPGPYAYRSFMPMASESSFFGDRPNYMYSDSEPGRGRAASLPESRRPTFRYITEPTMTWTEGIDDSQSEPVRQRFAWRRALRRVTRRARRGLLKVRELLQRDNKRSISGFQ